MITTACHRQLRSVYRQRHVHQRANSAKGEKLLLRTYKDGPVREERQEIPPQDTRPHDLLKRVRQETEKQLQQYHKKAKVFLIDNHLPQDKRFDFPKLMETMLLDFPQNKRNALVLTLGTLSGSIIAMKAKSLRERIDYVALLSAAGAAIPVPGLSLVRDVGMLVHESISYRNQLTVSENVLQQFSKETRTQLEKNFKDRIFGSFKGANPFVKEGIIAILKAAPVLSVLMVTEEFAKYISIVGTVTAATISAYTMRSTLNKILDVVEKSSLEYFREAIILVVENTDKK